MGLAPRRWNSVVDRDGGEALFLQDADSAAVAGTGFCIVTGAGLDGFSGRHPESKKLLTTCHHTPLLLTE